MIKCYIRKIQHHTFKNVKIEMCPTKIVIQFQDKAFSILDNEIVSYKVSGKNIHMEILGPKKNLNIIVTPYKKNNINIIEQHINKYFKKNIVMTTNPIFL